jgi:pyruvate formate lyase activating enzyme
MYRMRNLPHTPTESLERARNEALDAGLEYVYIGNIFGHPAASTVCPRDGTLLIRRIGLSIVENNLTAQGQCPVCREKIPGVWL